MSLFSLVILAVGLGTDATAVAISAGIRQKKIIIQTTVRMALAFGFFQFAMTVVGGLAGGVMAGPLSAVDHWIAFGLLFIVGAHMFWNGLHPANASSSVDPARGWTLLFLAIATSLDALAVGMSLALVGISLWFPAMVIGIVAAGMTVVGILLGGRLSVHWGERMEMFGGLLLLGIGIKILLEHGAFF